jgi:hypothetical protein
LLLRAQVEKGCPQPPSVLAILCETRKAIGLTGGMGGVRERPDPAAPVLRCKSLAALTPTWKIQPRRFRIPSILSSARQHFLL